MNSKLPKIAIALVVSATLQLAIAKTPAAGHCKQAIDEVGHGDPRAVCTREAEHGDANAQVDLGFMYEHGEGAPQDLSAAYRWYLKAAEQGHAVGQYNVASLLLGGRGTTKNTLHAIGWYKKSAQQWFAPAQLMLGNIYYHNEFGQRDVDQALRWYALAAEQGDAEAQRIAGLEYLDRKDFDRSFPLMLKAAEQDNADAQYFTGSNYLFGQGTPVNYAKASEWMQKAAQHQNAAAEDLLGVMYAYGQGVPQNSTLAAFWFRRSIAHGDHDAEADLDKLNRNTASQQRAMDAATSLLQTPTATATRWERATLEHDDAADGVSLRKCSFRSLNGFAFSVNRRGVCPVVVEVDPVSGTSRDLH